MLNITAVFVLSLYWSVNIAGEKSTDVELKQPFWVLSLFVIIDSETQHTTAVAAFIGDVIRERWGFNNWKKVCPYFGEQTLNIPKIQTKYYHDTNQTSETEGQMWKEKWMYFKVI